MLAAIRKFAKSWVAKILLGFLVVSFAIWGINDWFQPQTGDWVVKAGSRTVTTADFDQQFDQYKQALQQQVGQPLTNQQLVERGLHTRMLDELATREAFLEHLRRLNIIPADALVAEKLKSTPIFFDPVTGRFDQQAYESQLQRNNLTPEKFEALLRDDIAQDHYGSAVLAGLRAPRIYAAAAQAYESEMRDASVLIVHPGLVEAPPQPTDAQLTAFMQESASALRRPELRALTVVRFDPAAFAAQVQIDPAELQRQFAFRRERYGEPERRTLIQVPAKTAQAAAQAAQRLRAGENPATVARALGVEPIRYDNQPKSAITDRRVADAAFQLQPGQVSNPIQGELGFAVVQVLGVTPGKEVTLEQVRPEIEAALKAEGASERLNEVMSKFEDSKESGATLAEAARAVGVPVTALPPVSEQGQDERRQPVALEPELLRAAFELRGGEESELIDIGQGRYAVVRVERVIPPALPPLEQVRAELAQAWRGREMVRRLQARADAIAAQARSGTPLQTLAQQAGAPFQRFTGLTRGGQNMPPEVLGEVFNTKVGQVFVAGRQSLAVGRVDAVRFPPPVVNAGVLQQQVRAMGMELSQQLAEEAIRFPRTLVKVRTNPEQARAALGVAPEEEAER